MIIVDVHAHMVAARGSRVGGHTCDNVMSNLGSRRCCRPCNGCFVFRGYHGIRRAIRDSSHCRAWGYQIHRTRLGRVPFPRLQVQLLSPPLLRCCSRLAFRHCCRRRPVTWPNTCNIRIWTPERRIYRMPLD